MSTRCQVVIKDDGNEKLWFYRHSDGYPEGTLPSLEKFMNWVKEGRIRNNVEQASGWLVMIGAEEYGEYHNYKTGEDRPKTMEELFIPQNGNNYSGWKVGAYEPSVPQEHGDIEFLYTLDLVKLTIKVKNIYAKTTYYANGWKPIKKEVLNDLH